MLTGEGYSCNAVTCVTLHPCIEHEEISLNVLADRKCGIGGKVVFCAVVSEFDISCGPEVSELFWRFSAAEPVDFYVHGLGFAWNGGRVDYPYCC